MIYRRHEYHEFSGNIIHRLAPSDSIAELTSLLHRAFARLGAMGLNYTAVDQSVDVTSRRLARGECYIARSVGTMVGTILIEYSDPLSSCKWFAHPKNASTHQLAVDPASQTRGIGSLLMSFAERWAIERNYRGLTIDTAEPARHLIEFYTKRDYSPVGLAQWKGKWYRSIIMRKELR